MAVCGQWFSGGRWRYAVMAIIDADMETVDLLTFTEEILNGKLHFLCSV